MRPINHAKDYSINIASLPIPKNAIYGKIGDIYYYFDDLKQFAHNYAYYDVYIMHRTDKKFVHYIAPSNNFFISQIKKVVFKNHMYTLSCVYPLGLGRIKGTNDSKLNFARAKQAKADYLFRPSNADTKHAITDYSCSKTMNRWVSYR